ESLAERVESERVMRETVHPEPFDFAQDRAASRNSVHPERRLREAELKSNGAGERRSLGAEYSECAAPRLRVASGPIRLRPSASVQGARVFACASCSAFSALACSTPPGVDSATACFSRSTASLACPVLSSTSPSPSTGRDVPPSPSAAIACR